MIFWKGRGILILVFAALGFVAGMMTSSFFNEGSNTPMLISCWLAAVMVWVFALTGLGKSSKQTLIDPKTGGPVVITESHTLYFMPPGFWAGLLTLVAAWVTVHQVLDDDDSGERSGAMVSPGFRTADLFLTDSSQTFAQGNSPEAAKIAGEFAKLIKELRSEKVEKKSSGGGGEFRTYVYLQDGHCVVLTRVPDLRKFTQGAKDTMVQAAWLSAQKTVQEGAEGVDSLLVGLRGVILYERALRGKVVENLSGDQPMAGVNREIDSSDAKEFLEREFEELEKAKPAMARPVQAENGNEADFKGTPDEDPPVAVKEDKTPPAMPNMTGSAAAVEVPMRSESVPEGGKEEVSTGSLPTELRDWKDTSGRPLRASLVRFTDAEKTAGEFKREDGQVFVVPLERFGPEDQAFIQTLRAN